MKTNEIPRTTKRGFTIIELLVVISIIGILVALLFPAISAAIKKAKVARARAECLTIVNGARQYFTEYGKMPGGAGTDTTYGGIGSQPNCMLLNVLRAIDGPGNVGSGANTRRIVFVEVPAKSIDGSGCFNDPWGRQYEVTVDSGYDGSCEVVGGYGTVKDVITAVWSSGPDGIPHNEDDVTSW